MTPILDCVFLLLLFFAVSATFKHGSQIALTLPAAAGIKIEKTQHPVTVVVGASGRYSVNDELLGRNDAATLKTVIAALGVPAASTQLIIRADAQATHQAVVTVMDVAGQLGFVHVSIATVKPKSSS